MRLAAARVGIPHVMRLIHDEEVPDAVPAGDRRVLGAGAIVERVERHVPSAGAVAAAAAASVSLKQKAVSMSPHRTPHHKLAIYTEIPFDITTIIIFFITQVCPAPLSPPPRGCCGALQTMGTSELHQRKEPRARPENRGVAITPLRRRCHPSHLNQ